MACLPCGLYVLLMLFLNKWKDNEENRGMRVNMNKTKVIISGERQKLMQKAARSVIFSLTKIK